MEEHFSQSVILLGTEDSMNINNSWGIRLLMANWPDLPLLVIWDTLPAAIVPLESHWSYMKSVGQFEVSVLKLLSIKINKFVTAILEDINSHSFLLFKVSHFVFKKCEIPYKMRYLKCLYTIFIESYHLDYVLLLTYFFVLLCCYCLIMSNTINLLSESVAFIHRFRKKCLESISQRIFKNYWRQIENKLEKGTCYYTLLTT